MSGPGASQAAAEIDALVREGNLAEAAERLEAAIDEAAGSPAQWLQVAGLRRALGQPHKSLAAVHQALRHDPFDFFALVMRAGLLERLGDPECGPAWEEALAQRPAGDLAPPLAKAIAAGEVTLAKWRAARETRLVASTRSMDQHTNTDEAWRISRFRDNILRKTRPYRSEPTHFHFPGLVEREFHPRAAFPWLAELEAASGEIRAEMRAVMASSRAELVPYVQYRDHEALAQWQALNRNLDWTAIHLLRQGEIVSANAAQCPVTLNLLARLPQPRVPGASPNAMFSLLAPHTSIPAHVGVDNSRLVCHLPLVVPPGCWFRVGAETREWEEGQAFVFDDTIEHEAANPTDHLRIVLIFDVWHPGLSPVEQSAVAAIVAAAGEQVTFD